MRCLFGTCDILMPTATHRLIIRMWIVFRDVQAYCQVMARASFLDYLGKSILY